MYVHKGCLDDKKTFWIPQRFLALGMIKPVFIFHGVLNCKGAPLTQTLTPFRIPLI